jgi:hypothetical protein
MISDRARLAKNARQRQRYGRRHRQWRAELAPAVAQGFVRCARCASRSTRVSLGTWITTTSRPHLYLGPSLRQCNRAAANKLRTSREW